MAGDRPRRQTRVRPERVLRVCDFVSAGTHPRWQRSARDTAGLNKAGYGARVSEGVAQGARSDRWHLRPVRSFPHVGGTRWQRTNAGRGNDKGTAQVQGLNAILRLRLV